MNVLFLHQNFPGQFRHLVKHLAAQPGHCVVAVARDTAPGLEGIQTLRYKPHRDPAAQTHHYLRGMESAVLHGQAVFRVLQKLRARRFTPDVVVAHPGWGETLFVKEVFPQCRLIHFCEYYYRAEGADTGFDPEFPADADSAARIRVRNALHLLNLEQCDVAVAPTAWQRSLHPDAYLSKIAIVHEGVDTQTLGPDPGATLALPNWRTLRTGDPVVTYVARNLEPYRGFHVFMRTLPKILSARPDCHVVIVGGDDVSYGRKPSDAPNWREKMLREAAIDPQRVHFLGKVPYDTYRRVLQVSAAHVYLTYPFVLSWSMLEAMASGCRLIASDTAPVREVVEHERNGVLVDFFDVDGIAGTVVEALASAAGGAALRQAAQQTAHRHYSIERGIQGYLDLMRG